jgi:RNA polymerase sigma-70 factor, ECF subfamily
VTDSVETNNRDHQNQADDAAIQRVLGGDADAFRALVERYQNPVRRMVRNYTSDSHGYEDIAQEVFLTAYRKLAKFDPTRSCFSTWLFTITRNLSWNALRKTQPLVMQEIPERQSGANPDQQMQEQEYGSVLEKALQALPGRFRRAFVLAEIEKLSYEEIARIEGVRFGTVKSRIHRAKQKLQAALKPLLGEDI